MCRLLLLLLALVPLRAPAQSLRIAAAANLVHALPALNAAFAQEVPDVKITVAFGASGSLVAQITHGAPYDLFLSADLDYPRALIDSGHAVASTLIPFAEGRLALWTTRSDLPLHNLEESLRHPVVRKIAVAHPGHAPYGRATRQVLHKHGLWTAVTSRMVIGESISQAAQFVSSGNAEVGFVALSLILSTPAPSRGQWLELNATDHDPIVQGAVLTRAGAANPAAQRYLAFLQSPRARAVLEQAGYRGPTTPTLQP